MNRDQIDSFVKSDKVREFYAASWFVGAGADSNMNPASLFEKSDLRVLVAFLSPGKVRAVSNTYTALDAEIHSVPNVFVDYAYFPHREDLDTFNKYQLPYWFGNLSHAPVQDYDLVLVSTSILLDQLNIYHAYRACGIPDTHEARTKDATVPLIVAGGIPCADHDAWGGDSGIVDLIFVGFAEGELRKIIQVMVDAKKQGKVLNAVKKPLIKEIVKNSSSVYYPDGYEVKYFDVDGRRHEIESIKTKYDWVPEKVKVNNPWNIDDYPGFVNKIFNPDGSNATTTDFLVSWGCSGGGSCSFCAEGMNCGPWREKSLDLMIKEMDQVLKNSAANSLSPYSFNVNYVSRFIDLFYEVASRFSKTSLHNNRIDVMAEADDYFEAANFFGLPMVAMPIEGMGERMRNKVLNKSLSYEQIKQAFSKVFKSNAMQLKIGLVITGHETAEDIEDFSNELEGLLKLREEANSSLSMRVNCTMLVHYPHTAVGWLARNTSRMSYGKIRTMKQLTERFRNRIQFKFVSQEYGTLLEQLALDLGRLGTPIWRKLAQSGAYYYSGWSKNAVILVEKELKAVGVDIRDVFKERPRNWIFPVDMIPKKKEKYVDLIYNSLGKKNLIPCTKTPVNRKNVCYDCGACETKEQRDSITKRKIWNEHSLVDLQEAKFNNKIMSAYRVSFTVGEKYYLYSKEALAFKIAANIISYKDLYKKYHSVPFVSTGPMLRGNAEDWHWGNFFFDINMKDVDIDFSGALESFEMESCKVNSIVKIGQKKKHPPTAVTLYTADIKGVGVDTFQRAVKSWDKKLRMGVQGRFPLYGVVFEEFPQESLPEMYVRPIDGGIKLAVALPAYANGPLFLGSLFGRSYHQMMALSKWRVIGYFYQNASVCRCGSVKMLSLSTMTEPPVCTSCLLKAHLKM